MPRKLTQRTSLDSMEEEVQFTTAALTADEHTQDLIPVVSSWLPMIDAQRSLERSIRQNIANVDATRVLANEYLDISCTNFGIDLEAAVRKDKTSSRWTTYFKSSVSAFCRQALVQQVSTVFGWLATTDPVLEQYREDLTKRVNSANTALVSTNALSAQRAQLWDSRQKLADELTAQRDALWSTLSARARELGLPRTWPNAFFQVESKTKSEENGEAPAENGSSAGAATGTAGAATGSAGAA